MISRFDSPYLDYTAPATVAMSDSLAAVTFHKSIYAAGNQLIQDVHLITLSVGDGSLVTNTQWPEQGPLGLGPGIFCCTKNDEFYADGWLLIKNGRVVRKQKVNPVGPNRQKINVSLGNSNRPTTVEIVNEDGSKNTLGTDCGNVGDSFLSKDAFVVIGCNTLSVIGGRMVIYFFPTPSAVRISSLVVRRGMEKGLSFLLAPGIQVTLLIQRMNGWSSTIQNAAYPYLL
jgi:hypothetical protein